MSVTKLDKATLTDIHVSEPFKNDNLYLAKIQQNSKDLVLQTPKVKIVSITDENIEITLTKELEDFIKKYDEYMINIVSDNSNKWFSKELNKIKVAQIYKSSINFQNNAVFKIDDKINIYSNDKELKLNDVNEGMEVILLIHFSYLVFYKSNCIPYINTLHLKVKEIKPEIDFRELEEEQKLSIKIKVDDFSFN